MKKKLRDLTIEDMKKICKHGTYQDCAECPIVTICAKPVVLISITDFCIEIEVPEK